MAMTATQHANTLFISGTHSNRAIDRHMAPETTRTYPAQVRLIYAGLYLRSLGYSQASPSNEKELSHRSGSEAALQLKTH
jgi:hypothetical protein